MGAENRDLEKDYRLQRRYMALFDLPQRHRPRRCMSRIVKVWYGRGAAHNRWMEARRKAEAEAGIEVPKVVRLILV